MSSSRPPELGFEHRARRGEAAHDLPVAALEVDGSADIELVVREAHALGSKPTGHELEGLAWFAAFDHRDALMHQVGAIGHAAQKPNAVVLARGDVESA